MIDLTRLVKIAWLASVFGLIIAIVGVFLFYLPCIGVNVSVTRSSVIWDGPLLVKPGQRTLIPFNIPSEAINPLLRINVSVLGGSGNDIDLYVKAGNGDLVYRDRLSGYTYRTIKLPNPGSYSIVFSNNFSIISAKQVRGKIQIYYDQPVVRPELLSVTGLVIYVIGLSIVIFNKYKKTSV